MIRLSTRGALGNARGVTLIELMVVMVLLATALAGLAASFPLHMYGVTSGGNVTTATLLAQKCIDNAKAMAYDQVGTALPTVCPSGTVAGYSGFTQTLTISPAVPTATTTTVTVTVGFTSQAGGTTNETTLATILTQ